MTDKQIIIDNYFSKIVDINGEIVDYEIKNNEIVFLVNSNNKIVKIGENTPNLDVNEL